MSTSPKGGKKENSERHKTPEKDSYKKLPKKDTESGVSMQDLYKPEKENIKSTINPAVRKSNSEKISKSLVISEQDIKTELNIEDSAKSSKKTEQLEDKTPSSKEEFSLNSTNDFFPHMQQVGIYYVMIAIYIFAIQCTLIVFVITESLANGFDPNSNANNIDGYRLLFVVYPFLALYLAGKFSEQANEEVVKELSKMIKVGAFNLCDSTIGKSISTTVSLLFFWFFVCSAYPIILLKSLKAFLTNGLDENDFYGLGMCTLIWMETIQACLMIAALIFVIQEQMDIISILFNFAGLMIILELDEIAAKFLDVKVLRESEEPVESGDEEKDGGKKKKEDKHAETFRYFFGLVIFVAIYIALCFHAFPSNYAFAHSS